MGVEIIVEDNGVTEGFFSLAKDMRQAVLQDVTASQDRHIQGLQQMVRQVVYDIYNPKVYKRNFNLITAVDSEVVPIDMGAQLTLFDNPEKVTLRRGGISAGGSKKEDVPIEIEEGTYPPMRRAKGTGDTPRGGPVTWLGYSLPRPAYQMYLELIIDRTIEEETDQIVSPVIAQYFP